MTPAQFRLIGHVGQSIADSHERESSRTMCRGWRAKHQAIPSGYALSNANDHVSVSRLRNAIFFESIQMCDHIVSFSSVCQIAKDGFELFSRLDSGDSANIFRNKPKRVVCFENFDSGLVKGSELGVVQAFALAHATETVTRCNRSKVLERVGEGVEGENRKGRAR